MRGMDSQIASLIKRLRASGMTQTEIAKRTGIPQPRLSRWEAGDTPTVANDALKLVHLVASLDKPRRRRASAA